MAMPIPAPPETFPVPTQSLRLFGLDWSKELPWTLDGVRVEAGRFADVMPFMKAHYAAIFGRNDASFAWAADPMTEAKARFCDELDVFLFRESGGAVVGVFMGHPSDWATYYLRSVAILPAWREKSLFSRFVRLLAAPLSKVGIERVDGEVSPANHGVIRCLQADGYVVTAMTNSERWGTLVRYSKFLRGEAEDVFLRQFCGPQFKRRAVRSSEVQERSTP